MYGFLSFTFSPLLRILNQGELYRMSEVDMKVKNKSSQDSKNEAEDTMMRLTETLKFYSSLFCCVVGYT